MQRIRGSKILIYAFFQIFILAAARGIVAPLIPLISGELGVGLDYIGSAIALSIFALFFVSLTTGNLIEIMGLKEVLFIGLGINFAGFSPIIFLIYFSGVYYCILPYGNGCGNAYNRESFHSRDFLSQEKDFQPYKDKLWQYRCIYNIAPLLVSLILYFKIDWRYYYMIHPVTANNPCHYPVEDGYTQVCQGGDQPEEALCGK